MRKFGTQGPVNSKDHYVVPREQELADYIDRVKQGRYIVLFAPRQTGKTTFFKNALSALTEEGMTFFPIQLNFEDYKNRPPDVFTLTSVKIFWKKLIRYLRGEVSCLLQNLNNF